MIDTAIVLPVHPAIIPVEKDVCLKHKYEMETDDFELQSSDEGNKTRRIVENIQDESTVVAVTDSDENESTCKCIER